MSRPHPSDASHAPPFPSARNVNDDLAVMVNAAEVKSDTPPPSSSSGGLLQNEKSPLDDFRRRQRDAEATADDNVHS